METEVTVNYNKSGLGKGSKDKLEHPDMMMSLLCAQACGNRGASPSTASNSDLNLNSRVPCRNTVSFTFVSFAVSTAGPHRQWLLNNF